MQVSPSRIKLYRIQDNTEGWENDKGRESSINYDFKCIKTFMNTDDFRNISTTYGLDSQIVANFYKAFASYFCMPKDSFESFKNYHEPYKDKTFSHVTTSVEVNTVDHNIPKPYIERVPFPAKIRDIL